MPKVLLALTSHAELGDTGRATGFSVPEAAHPYRIFTAEGFEVDLVSVKGGQPPRDGVKAGAVETSQFLTELGHRLAHTPTTDQLSADDYQVVFFVGGHGAMWDLPDSKELSQFAATVYENGGVVAGVCHGPAGLVNIRLSDSSYLVDGKLVSAFTNEEEDAIGLTDTVPFALESKLVERGARFTKAPNFAVHAVADQRLVTGQNPASATRVAQLVVEELRRSAAENGGESRGMSASQMSALYLLDESVSFLFSASLRAATMIGVADHMADGPRTAEELAAATGTQPDLLYRTLRLLATRRIFREEDGRFYLTPQGDALRTDAPVSVRDAIMMTTASSHWQSAGELVTALQDGTPVFERLFGAPYYNHIKGGEAGDVFNRGMASFSAAVDQVAIQQCDFPQFGTLVDVGGGVGGLLVQALQSRPGLRGVLFDQEHVLAGHQLGELDSDERWQVVTGDFFSEVPAGGDVYVLKRILHNWSDAECVQILDSCRRAMAPGGRVMVIDPVVTADNGPDSAKVHDMIMMILLTGRERTESEFADLLDEAGLRLTRTIHTGAPVSIIEAVAR